MKTWLTFLVGCLLIWIMLNIFIGLGVFEYMDTPVKQVPKSIECHEYIPPCNEEITFNTDVPNKCWIEED